MNKALRKIEQIEADPAVVRRLLIVAQVFALAAYGLGLQFLISTTGGTLFLFSVVAPGLVVLGLGILLGIVAWRFLRSHSLFHLEEFGPGEVIFQEGDAGDCAYFIHSGEVEVITGKGAQQHVVARLSQGQYFGEMALITSHPRNATVRAVTHTKAAVLGKQNFLTMVSVIPATREDIMKTVNERAMQQAAGQ